MAKKVPNRVDEFIFEMATDMHRTGLLEDAEYEKITLRHVKASQPAISPITGATVRQARKNAHLSQAVFARKLNLTPGYISQLERGVKQPTGAALVLLDLVSRKGIEAIL